MSSMIDHNDAYNTLFRAVCVKVPTTLPQDSWYLLTAAALIGSGQGAKIAGLYKYVVSERPLDDHCIIWRNLHAVVMKTWALVGMPRASEGFYALQNLNPGYNISQEFSRPDLAANPAKALKQTSSWWELIFGEEAADIDRSIEHDPDFQWTVKFIVYGLYISDLSVLNALESEIVVLASVGSQGHSRIQDIHLRALSRLGLSTADLEVLPDIIRLVASGPDTTHQSISPG